MLVNSQPVLSRITVEALPVSGSEPWLASAPLPPRTTSRWRAPEQFMSPDHQDVVILAVGTRVTLSHGGHGLAKERASWPLRIGICYRTYRDAGSSRRPLLRFHLLRTSRTGGLAVDRRNSFLGISSLPPYLCGPLIAKYSVAVRYVTVGKAGSMSRAWKVALLLALVLLFGMVVSLAWGAPQKADEPKMPVFSVKDHKLIEDYYNHLVGTLAPGSLDRSGFPFGIEESLVTGSNVPMQLET